jgi:hypothetical protein
MIPTSIDGTDITGATIDGTDVTEITVDGQTVFTASQPWETADLVHDYDAANLSTGALNTFPDQQGNNDASLLTGNPTVTGTKNGLNYVVYDGNDAHRVVTGQSFNSFTLIAVVKSNRIGVNGNTGNIIISDANEYYPSIINEDTDTIRYRTENSFLQGGTPQQWNVITVIKDATNAELRQNGTVIDSGTVANESFDPVTIGAGDTGINFSDIDLGQALIYNADISSDISTVESALQTRWGI